MNPARVQEYPAGRDLRGLARSIWEAALARLEPEPLVEGALRAGESQLVVAGRCFALRPGARVRLVALGKAADAQARAAARRLGDRLTDGLVVTRAGEARHPPPPRVEVVESAHPLPDARSLGAGERIAAFLRGGRPTDLVLLLVSGGASALAVLPRPPVDVGDLRAVTDLLLKSGTPIHELNVVRKHLDLLKGGGLVRLAAPARLAALLLSDVVGDSPATIGSGPATPDPSTFADALAVLERRGVIDRTPERVRKALERGLAGDEPETLKPGDPLAARGTTALLASSGVAVEAAADRAAALGFPPLVLGVEVEGEAREVGRVLAEVVREVATQGRPVPPPAALVWAGETTVTVRGPGLGGRNQELALAAALALEGLDGVCLVSLGTDGTDGPTDAAGAAVDGATAGRARALGVDLTAALVRNDSYRALDVLGALIRTGPTGTNVSDLGFALVAGRERP